jgi:hypothetical protein
MLTLMAGFCGAAFISRPFNGRDLCPVHCLDKRERALQVISRLGVPNPLSVKLNLSFPAKLSFPMPGKTMMACVISLDPDVPNL